MPTAARTLICQQLWNTTLSTSNENPEASKYMASDGALCRENPAGYLEETGSQGAQKLLDFLSSTGTRVDK